MDYIDLLSGASSGEYYLFGFNYASPNVAIVFATAALY